MLGALADRAAEPVRPRCEVHSWEMRGAVSPARSESGVKSMARPPIRIEKSPRLSGVAAPFGRIWVLPSPQPVHGLWVRAGRCCRT